MRYRILRVTSFSDYGTGNVNFYGTNGKVLLSLPKERIKVRKLFRGRRLYVLIKEAR